MTRFRPVTEEDVARLADRVGVAFGPDEVADAADRLNTLASIYEELEAASTDVEGARSTASETFDAPPTRAAADDPRNAWITRFELARGDGGPLAGLDVAVKDNTCVRGVELTCGSHAMEGVVPGDHAAVVDRLLDAGARLVGKTNMDEFAFGPTSETSAFGPTENPVAPGHVAGGSSAGSAAAVAAGEVDLALGTDTGGSVRIPASYCGIVGVKPTYGRVPLHGVVPLAFSMDHVGTLAPDVETATRGLAAIADAGPADVAPIDPDRLGADAGDLTVGWAAGFFDRHTSDAVEATVRGALDDLADAGAAVREVEIPALTHSRQAWWGIAPAEFAAELATSAAGLWRRGETVPSLVAALGRVRRASGASLGANVKEMLALGAYLTVARDGYHYARARNLRAALTAGFDDALADVDVIAAPGTPTTALELDGFERGVTPPVNWVTHPTNLTGHPSAVLPCGESDGLPVGLQFIGPTGADQAVLDAARAYERLD
ncbi:MAG: amidase [Haloferacaceae archaeon]